MNSRFVHLTFGAAGVIGLVLAIGWYLGWGQVAVGGDLVADPVRVAQVEQRIDPNTAEAPVLAALPGIGEQAARRIVQYRREKQARAGQTVVFKTRDDLLLIRGIGEKTLRKIEPYLVFPTPTSCPDR